MSATNAGELLILDTGAILQLQTQERFTTLVRGEYAAASQIGACALALPEAIGAAHAMLRRKALNRREYRQVVHFIYAEWQQWLILAVTPGVVQKAAGLCEHYPLKGMDAIHLAAVKSIAIFRPVRFLTLDKTLYRCAQAEGIALVPIRFQ